MRPVSRRGRGTLGGQRRARLHSDPSVEGALKGYELQVLVNDPTPVGCVRMSGLGSSVKSFPTLLHVVRVSGSVEFSRID